jgi:hypothetical protein
MMAKCGSAARLREGSYGSATQLGAVLGLSIVCMGRGLEAVS